MQKRKTSEEQKHHLIELWKQSGLSQKEFSSQHGINYATFHLWVKSDKEKPSTKPGFVPVSFDSVPASSEIKIEIAFPSGIKLNFFYQPDLLYLQNLLQFNR